MPSGQAVTSASVEAVRLRARPPLGGRLPAFSTSRAASSADFRPSSTATLDVRVGGEDDAGVAELVGDCLQLHARQQHQRRRPVPQVVEADRRQARLAYQGNEGTGQDFR